MSLIQSVAAGLLVLGSYLVIQVALTDRFDPHRRQPRAQARDEEEDTSTWRRAA